MFSEFVSHKSILLNIRERTRLNYERWRINSHTITRQLFGYDFKDHPTYGQLTRGVMYVYSKHNIPFVFTKLK